MLEFRDAIREYTLTCGEAREIFIMGQDVALARPSRDAMVNAQLVAGPAVEITHSRKPKRDTTSAWKYRSGFSLSC